MTGTDGGYPLLDVTTGKVIADLPNAGGDVPEDSAAAFGPDGTLATTSMDGDIYLWDVATRSVTATFTDPAGIGDSQVMAMVFGPDGKTLTVTDLDGSTYLWRISG